MSGIGLFALAHQQRAQAERVGLELARAMASAVDAELRSTVAVLESLATTTALDRGDLPAFGERARRILDTRPQWAAIALADPSRTPLADTRVAPGAALPPIADVESFDRAVRTRAPVVGNLSRNAPAALLFPVRVPVMRNGELRYILTAVVKPDEVRYVV